MIKKVLSAVLKRAIYGYKASSKTYIETLKKGGLV